MIILQNAYNAYLTKKYEKEINEFVEISHGEIDGLIKENEFKILNEIYLTQSSTHVISDLKNKVILMKELKECLSDPLTIDVDKFKGLGLNNTNHNYGWLNNLIVEGESKQFEEVEIEGVVDFSKASLIGLNTCNTSSEIGKALTSIYELLSNTIKKIETTEINLTVNDGNTTASQFAKDIMNEIKKNKGTSSK